MTDGVDAMRHVITATQVILEAECAGCSAIRLRIGGMQGSDCGADQ
jgi:hypothetical protein